MHAWRDFPTIVLYMRGFHARQYYLRARQKKRTSVWTEKLSFSVRDDEGGCVCRDNMLWCAGGPVRMMYKRYEQCGEESGRGMG
jgi:hypothetical protein